MSPTPVPAAPAVTPMATPNEEGQDVITEILTINFRGPFFGDPFFKSSWAIIEQQKAEYETKNHIEPGKFSLEKDLPFRSAIIESPHVVDTGNKFSFAASEVEPEKPEPTDAVEAKAPQYQVILDIQHFSPEEITITGRFSVKEEAEQSTLTIEGKHEEKADPTHHGVVSRHFTRKYSVPTDVQLDQIQCNMSSDGILQIVMPKIPPPTSSPKDSPAETEIIPADKAEEGFVSKMKHRLVDPIVHLMPDFHLVPFWHRSSQPKPTMGIQSDGKGTFRILVNVKDFSPEELKIDCSEYVVRIEAKHDAKRDQHGSLSRAFSRIYDMPKCVRANDIWAELLAGGILEIKAPKALPADIGTYEMKSVPLAVSPEAQEEMEEEARREKNQELAMDLWLLDQI